ncbi:CopG family transcriptional regulator [Brasilonema sp. CT11]|nr:CopG family transcriptional regulator [Brasilonema sp. CT11]
MARPGGNPDFGTKYKFTNGDKPIKTKVLGIRMTPEELKQIKDFFGSDYSQKCRDILLQTSMNQTTIK